MNSFFLELFLNLKNSPIIIKEYKTVKYYIITEQIKHKNYQIFYRYF